MKKYNIGLFNDSFPPNLDGVAQAVVNYAKNIQKNHGDCTVVTPKYPAVTDNYDFEVCRYSSAAFSKQIGYRVGNVAPLKTLYQLRRKKFDLMHVHSPFVSSIVAAELRRLSPPIPTVVTYHTKFEIEIARRVKMQPFMKLAAKFVVANLKRADEVWVVSEGTAESLRKIGYNGSYRVMPNGTDFEKGRVNEYRISDVKKSLSIKKGEFVFFFVGRLWWYKNIKLVMDALRRLPSDIKFKMVFVGDGYDRPAMEHYARQIGLYDNCRFVGAVYDRERLRDYFCAADLMLFPSTYDTSGLVVLEAAACCLPAVLIRGSCAAEGVTDMKNGFLCEENVLSLRDKIAEAVSDKARLKKIGEEAQNSVYMSWEDAVEVAYKRYEEIIENYRPRRKRFFKRR